MSDSRIISWIICTLTFNQVDFSSSGAHYVILYFFLHFIHNQFRYVCHDQQLRIITNDYKVLEFSVLADWNT